MTLYYSYLVIHTYTYNLQIRSCLDGLKIIQVKYTKILWSSVAKLQTNKELLKNQKRLNNQIKMVLVVEDIIGNENDIC